VLFRSLQFATSSFIYNFTLAFIAFYDEAFYLQIVCCLIDRRVDNNGRWAPCMLQSEQLTNDADDVTMHVEQCRK